MGELDFVIHDSEGVLPIEVKSGKDYERHNALNNVLECVSYNIPKAYVLNNSNIGLKGKIVYAPVYMTMFMKRESGGGGVYKVDLLCLQ